MSSMLHTGLAKEMAFFERGAKFVQSVSTTKKASPGNYGISNNHSFGPSFAFDSATNNGAPISGIPSFPNRFSSNHSLETPLGGNKMREQGAFNHSIPPGFTNNYTNAFGQRYTGTSAFTKIDSRCHSNQQRFMKDCPREHLPPASSTNRDSRNHSLQAQVMKDYSRGYEGSINETSFCGNGISRIHSSGARFMNNNPSADGRATCGPLSSSSRASRNQASQPNFMRNFPSEHGTSNSQTKSSRNQASGIRSFQPQFMNNPATENAATISEQSLFANAVSRNPPTEKVFGIYDLREYPAASLFINQARQNQLLETRITRHNPSDNATSSFANEATRKHSIEKAFGIYDLREYPAASLFTNQTSRSVSRNHPSERRFGIHKSGTNEAASAFSNTNPSNTASGLANSGMPSGIENGALNRRVAWRTRRRFRRSNKTRYDVSGALANDSQK